MKELQSRMIAIEARLNGEPTSANSYTVAPTPGGYVELLISAPSPEENLSGVLPTQVNLIEPGVTLTQANPPAYPTLSTYQVLLDSFKNRPSQLSQSGTSSLHQGENLQISLGGSTAPLYFDWNEIYQIDVNDSLSDPSSSFDMDLDNLPKN